MKKNLIVAFLTLLLLVSVVTHRVNSQQQFDLELDIYSVAIADLRARNNKLANFTLFIDDVLEQISNEEPFILSSREEALLLNLRQDQSFSHPKLWQLRELNILWHDYFTTQLQKEKLEAMSVDGWESLRHELQQIRDVMSAFTMEYETGTLTLDLNELMTRFHNVAEILIFPS